MTIVSRMLEQVEKPNDLSDSDIMYSRVTVEGVSYDFEEKVFGDIVLEHKSHAVVGALLRRSMYINSEHIGAYSSIPKLFEVEFTVTRGCKGSKYVEDTRISEGIISFLPPDINTRGLL